MATGQEGAIVSPSLFPIEKFAYKSTEFKAGKPQLCGNLGAKLKF